MVKRGHVQKNCKTNKKTPNKPAPTNEKIPGLCLHCNKDDHWANQCRSRFVKMDPLHWETGRRVLLRACQTTRALNKPGTLFLCVPSKRTATSSSPFKPYTRVADLLPTTSGSATLDTPTTDNLLLMPAMGIYKIPIGIKGPMPKGSVRYY